VSIFRSRLTAVWYYTRGLEKDRAFLAHTQETLDLLKEMVVPFDAVFVGIMDKDAYTQIVSTDTLAKFTRRESVCGHTINQPAGTVLYLPDMRLDAHFAGSPLVTDAGLVSYIGAPLRFTCERADGTREDVVLGGLCATSYMRSGPIVDYQQHRVLVRFADLIVHDIVERAKSVRLAERHRMDARINALSTQASGDNALDLVLAALRETYSDAHVSLQTCPDDIIELIGTDAVPYAEFTDGLWEATAEVDTDIRDFNHLPLSARPWDQTLRAAAAPCPGIPQTYLVVQIADMAHVLDDIDATFVCDCAHVLARAHRAAAERAAHAAFFRDFAHELRAPIHAVLRSCEQLVGGMKTMTLSGASAADSADDAAASDHYALLNNTVMSGHALLNTVNSLLDLGALNARAPALASSVHLT
jgi:hypothetical protein